MVPPITPISGKGTTMAKKCKVEGCGADAEYEVILYDVYLNNGKVFFEQDFTCPYLCAKHVVENEKKAQGERKPRGVVDYPYTNRNAAQGFTIYRPLK